MRRMGLRFKNSKSLFVWNGLKICPYLTEKHTAPVVKTSRLMLLTI
jgi:hypothetical protein